MKSVDDVRKFWENNPLWSGESAFPQGSKEYFEEHRRVCIDDGFAGRLDERIFPDEVHRDSVLDLGCGPGFWTIELGKRGCKRLVASDLTQRALELAAQRCALFGVQAEFSQQNAEAMTFESGRFSHVNCQGVIHHTPNTEACIAEIARVLRPRGTASVSVYYRNLILRSWPVLGWSGKLLSRAGWRLRGRGRESIFEIEDINEIVRMYDGSANPIGKAYSRAQFRAMLEPHFRIERLAPHFFPARALPFRIPAPLHGFFDSFFGFLIYASLTKR
jgi:2-polyprenyl-3-methyl-5-hydroxy-6-metoxy-1,4-benzoquinol methylase